MLADYMTKRHDSGVPEARPDPGFDGILATLGSISSQTSTFQWTEITKRVEARFQAEIPEYRFNPDGYRVEPSLLLGAIEAFYRVQSLPEDRKVIVNNRVGAVILTAWAHSLLGLHVVIDVPSLTGNAHTSIDFPTDSPPQVIIKWMYIGSYSDSSSDLAPAYPRDSGASGPEVQLLDSDDSVLLRCFPEDHLQDSFEDQGEARPIQVQDQHPLQGWGKLYMHRALNSHTLVPSDDSIYKELVKHVIALALFYVRGVARSVKVSNASTGTDSGQRDLFKSPFKSWRVIAAAEVIFDDIGLDIKGVQSYLDSLDSGKTIKGGVTCASQDLPNAYSSYLKRSSTDTNDPEKGMRMLIDRLTHVLIVTSYIADITKCKDMPIIVDNMGRGYSHVRPRLVSTVIDTAIFQAVFCLFTDNRTGYERHLVGGEDVDLRSLWLRSDRGWSVFYGSAGDGDPAEVTPELVHVERGVPTHTSTGERRNQIFDATIRSTLSMISGSFPLIHGSTYIPQASTEMKK